MFASNTPMMATDQHPSDARSMQASCPTHLRSVPPIVRREMHRAEPVEVTPLLRWQAWTKPLVDGVQTMHRIMTQPLGHAPGQSQGQQHRDH
ncbi:hypothetical protein CA85_27090 [Allorhodopirellula solitaria]|uniref:Uncharacterized protein n=1 Tax=Allorhodopirellula solitaria TaxID=2527987 RepID=A0A5C5XYQ9_9BACT|nr:hypothetical protein CA85_27090 [Allorhodopirellula solitaria]